MVEVRALLVKLFKDESAGEMAEYALIGGLIVILVVSAVALVGKKLSLSWATIQKLKM